jgi:PAS domain S-box-containing protein
VTSLRRLVLLVVTFAVAVQLGARQLLDDAGPVVPHSGLLNGLPPLVLILGLLLLAVAGDLLCVPVRRGEETEDLTLYESAVVVAVLLLPARDALWVPAVAVVLTSLLQRRQPLKALFNVGNLSAATALLVVLVHLLSGPGQGLGWQTVLALLAGLLVFSAFNLLTLTQVLKVVGEGDAKQVLVDGVRLGLVMSTATVAVGGGAVVMGGAAPAMLPFSLVPGVALLFAYRATAQSAEQRQRSARLLALSHVLAGRVEADELLPAFLSQCRQAFGAGVALALVEPGVVPGFEQGVTAVDERGAGSSQRETVDAERALLGRPGDEARLVTGPLPHGWLQAIVAPLEADGEPLGALVLANRDKGRPLGAAELTLLTPLASALAVALRGAAHLRRLTEETSKLQAVVDQSSDGILVLDGGGSVLLWSPALTALTGRAEAEAVGRPLSGLVRTAGTDGAARDPFAAGRDLLTPLAPQATVELVLMRDDGEERVVRCAHAGVFTGDELVRDVVIVHDITRERQVERLKADFIATVSHELRTPVTPIKGYADLLRRRGDDMTKERRDECLQVIGDRCDHLARLVEDLLLASRISATEGSATAQVDQAEGDLVALVHRAAGDFGADGSRVRLALPSDPVRVTCDPMRVIQVLTNLIGNALKYSPADSPVQVRLVVDGGQAYVDVVDSGRGIPADQLERVFEKFHRVEDPMRMTTGGTGLGLYIARQLATAMGGSLTCASTLGAGSVFRFALQRVAGGAVAVSPPVPWTVVPVPVSLRDERIPRADQQLPAPRGGEDRQLPDAASGRA